MTVKINCLDCGFVRLVDYMGGDINVVRAARVSYDADWRAGQDEKSDEKLINYLWSNHHTTPFEAVTFTFEIKAPIFVIRQWHRHRTWSYNELSARYKELPEEFYIPEINVIGQQSTHNKQVRVMPSTLSPEENRQKADEIAEVILQNEAAFKLYRSLLEKGWPRELARSVLPVSTYTHMFATVNLLNLLKFLTLRTHSHAQYEIKVYAEAMLNLIREIVPVSVAAWEKSQNRT